MRDSEDTAVNVKTELESDSDSDSHPPSQDGPNRGRIHRFVYEDSSDTDCEDMVVNVKTEVPSPGRARGRGRSRDRGNSTSGRGRGRGRRSGGEPTEPSSPLAKARLAIKEKRKQIAQLQPKARKRLEEETRAAELHRVLLPDSPPRKRRRNILSPVRHPCVIAEPVASTAADVNSVPGPSRKSKRGRKSAEDVNSVPRPSRKSKLGRKSAEDVNSVPGPSRKSKRGRKSAEDVNSVPGPSTPNLDPKSAEGEKDRTLDESMTELVTLLGNLDTDSDIDDHDIDTDEVYAPPIPFNAASEPAANEDMTLQDQAVLMECDEANDAALREIVPSDLSFDFRWQNDRTTFTGRKEIFTGPTPGPTFPLTNDTSPVDIYDKMFNTDFLDRLVTETNRYARQTIDKLTELGKIKPKSRLHRWTPTDRDEMVSFLAVLILHGLYPLPKEESYFGFNGYGTMPYMSRIMSYNRFLLLKMFLNFVDNDSLTDAHTKLGKIQPILDYFNERFSSMYNLSPNIVIDESLLKWQGRLGFSQKIKTKAAKVGIKTYELCESSSGYLWSFFVYTGKSYSKQTDQDTATEEIDTSNALTTEETDMTDTTEETAIMTITTATASITTATASTTTATASTTTATASTTTATASITTATASTTTATASTTTATASTTTVTTTSTTSPETRPTNATAKIVYDLIEPLLDRGHVLVMDNFYNCPLLARCLKRQKTDCYGTLRLNREFVPDSVKTLTKGNMRQGEVVTSYCEDLAVMVWRDANLVSMITTCHSLQVSPQQKYDKLTYKPDLVLDYNKSMGGVDRKDQFLSAIPIERDRNKEWYKKLFRRLYSVALFNCFVLYRTKNPQMAHRSFRQVLAEDLLRRHRKIDLATEPRIFAQRRTTENGVTSVTVTRRHYHSANNYGVFLEQNHFPVRTGSKRTSCFLCARRKVAARTIWKCEECDINLCIEYCFKQFHKIQYPLSK